MSETIEVLLLLLRGGKEQGAYKITCLLFGDPGKLRESPVKQAGLLADCS